MAVLLAAGGLLVLAMVGLSAYGFAALPRDAKVPVHWLGSYGTYVSRRAGLIVWPAFGAVFEGLLAVILLDAAARGRLAGAVVLVLGMGSLLAAQAGAVVAAHRRAARPGR